MRRTPIVAALAATVLSAAGCSGDVLTDEGAHPGAAAEVGGEELALRTVDRSVVDYCELRAANEQASALPTALIRGQFVTGWSQAVAVEHLADDYGVDLPPDDIDRAEVEATWGELGTIDDDNYETFEFLTWIQQRLSGVVEEIGAEALGDEDGDPSADPAARGVELITEWLEDNDLVINPVFGTFDAETLVFAGDLLSVPVSEEAVAAVDTAELAPEQVAELPAAQRCGPSVSVAAPAPGA